MCDIPGLDQHRYLLLRQCVVKMLAHGCFKVHGLTAERTFRHVLLDLQQPWKQLFAFLCSGHWPSLLCRQLFLM
jgi:hypothetical protein